MSFEVLHAKKLGLVYFFRYKRVKWFFFQVGAGCIASFEPFLATVTTIFTQDT